MEVREGEGEQLIMFCTWKEEIRFAICPILTSCLSVVEVMKEDEAILLTGAERYSDYKGYGLCRVLLISMTLLMALVATPLD